VSYRVSGSSFVYLKHCQHTIAVKYPQEDISEKSYIKFGNAVHEAIEHGTLPKDEEQAEHVISAEKFLVNYVASLGDAGWSLDTRLFEPAFGILASGEKLGVAYLGAGRDQYADEGKPEYLVGATADVALVFKKGNCTRVDVIDWKTGRENPAYVDQMKILCGMAEEHFQADEVYGVIFYTSGQTDSVTLCDPSGIHFALALKAAIRAAKSEDFTPRFGDHCDHYCPGQGACPVYKDQSWLVPVGNLVRNRSNPLVNGIKNDYDLECALDLIDYAEVRMKALSLEAKMYAESRGKAVELPSGRVFKKIEQNRSAWAPTKLVEIAKKHGATDEELASARSSSTASYYQRFGKEKKT
jgi:hypothetical protein